MTTTRRPANVARPARTVGSVPVSSVHDEQTSGGDVDAGRSVGPAGPHHLFPGGQVAVVVLGVGVGPGRRAGARRERIVPEPERGLDPRVDLRGREHRVDQAVLERGDRLVRLLAHHLAGGLGHDARSGEPDHRAGLDRPQVAQRPVGREHAAGGGRAVHRDREQPGLGVATGRGGGPAELDERDHPLLHAGPAAAGHAHDREAELGGPVEGPADALAGDHTHRAAEGVEPALDEHVVLGPAGPHRLLRRVLQGLRVPGEVAADHRCAGRCPTPPPAAPSRKPRFCVRPSPKSETTARRNGQTGSAEVDGDLVGQEATAAGEAGPVGVDLDQAVEPLEAGVVEGVGGHAAGGAEAELQALEAAAVGVEPLVGGLGRAALLDRVDVALGRAQVPEPAAGAVGVGGAADPEVLALGPVEEVVPALVAGLRPVRDLVPAVARPRSGARRRRCTCRPGRRRRGGGPGRRPAASRARRSGRRRSRGQGRGRSPRRGCAPSRPPTPPRRRR